AKAVESGLDEELRAGGKVLDKVPRSVAPSVVDEGVADGAGGGIDGIRGSLESRPTVVPACRRAHDEVAGERRVVTLILVHPVEIVEILLRVEVDLAVRVSLAIAEVVEERRDAIVRARGVDVIRLPRDIAVAAGEAAVVNHATDLDHV